MGIDETDKNFRYYLCKNERRRCRHHRLSSSTSSDITTLIVVVPSFSLWYSFAAVPTSACKRLPNSLTSLRLPSPLSSRSVAPYAADSSILAVAIRHRRSICFSVSSRPRCHCPFIA